MTTSLLGLTVLLAALAAQSPAIPAPPVPAPPRAPEINQDKPDWSKKAYEQLFKERIQELERQQAPPRLEWKGDAEAPPQISVECGTIVLRSNIAVDPRMIVRAPERHGSKVRTIPMPDCK